MFHERGASVQLALPGEPVVLKADADRLMQVVLNLLSNAAKFVPEQGGRVDIVLSTDAAGVSVSVQDNGPGVPAAQQTLVFEKFRQGGDGVSRPQGTGLGLPISRQIIAHFGGRLWLDSGATAGARFVFWLPCNTIPAASVSKPDREV